VNRNLELTADRNICIVVEESVASETEVWPTFCTHWFRFCLHKGTEMVRVTTLRRTPAHSFPYCKAASCHQQGRVGF